MLLLRVYVSQRVSQVYFNKIQKKFLQAGSDDDEVAKIEALIKQRNEARAAKDWTAADAARNELTAMGIVLEDGANGTTWRKQ